MTAARVLLGTGATVGFDDLERGFAEYPDAVIYANPDGTAFDGDANGHPVMDVLDAVEAGLLVGDADLIRAERAEAAPVKGKGKTAPDAQA